MTTSIPWCNHVAEPWRGCNEKSEGCANCWAKALSHRNPKTLGVWGTANQGGTRPLSARGTWDRLHRWQRSAAKRGVYESVFTAKCDVFDDFPGLDDTRAEYLDFCQQTPNLIHLLLTKRPENVARMVPSLWLAIGFPKNVMLGISVENQKRADERFPLIRQFKARKFVSFEPLLGIVSAEQHLLDDPGIEWVIVGAESGTSRRPFSISWLESIWMDVNSVNHDRVVEFTGAPRIAFFAKQDSHRFPDRRGNIPDRLWIREFPHPLNPPRDNASDPSHAG